MDRIKKYFALSFAVIALTIAGFGTQSFAAAKPEKSVEQQIYSKLRGLPRYGVFDNITYQVNGDTVVLSGKVITLGTKRDAATAVKDIPGIKNVVNNIEELPVGSFDDRIRRAALVTFTNRGPGQYFSTINPDVRIIVQNGRLTLEGFVSSRSDANTLNILANGINGVFEVTNNLIVGRDTRRS
ncbi:MAG TPA: BON domain-containing protein [Pyrinomonadaceae bacterium]|nr:BON domain-containing protein [Acidobacteriota bacterium]HQZ98498.1 BON domain-containing protein [Pyrinomonadaceae bacterium]